MKRHEDTFVRQIRTSIIRSCATELVGECSDYQIMFCASAASRIQMIGLTLEELDDVDLRNLYNWMLLERDRFF